VDLHLHRVHFLVRSVIKHAILCVQVQSPVGRNYVMCYERYGFKVEDEFRSGTLWSQIFVLQ